MEGRKKTTHRKRKRLCKKNPKRLKRSQNGQMKPFGSQDAFCIHVCRLLGTTLLNARMEVLVKASAA